MRLVLAIFMFAVGFVLIYHGIHFIDSGAGIKGWISLVIGIASCCVSGVNFERWRD